LKDLTVPVLKPNGAVRICIDLGGPSSWRASETLLGVTNENRRYMYMYIYIYISGT